MGFVEDIRGKFFDKNGELIDEVKSWILLLTHQLILYIIDGDMRNTTDKELTLEEREEQRQKDFNKEMYVQGIFMGFIIGALYIAVFSSILETL